MGEGESRSNSSMLTVVAWAKAWWDGKKNKQERIPATEKERIFLMQKILEKIRFCFIND